VPFKPKLTRERALTLIRKAVAESKVLWTTHVWDQMLAHHIVDTQVLAVLAEAEITTGPRWDETYEDWVFTMSKLVSGRIVTAVVAIDEYEEVSIVTTY
jgi:deoxycytidylate deaminase